MWSVNVVACILFVPRLFLLGSTRDNLVTSKHVACAQIVCVCVSQKQPGHKVRQGIVPYFLYIFVCSCHLFPSIDTGKV